MCTLLKIIKINNQNKIFLNKLYVHVLTKTWKYLQGTYYVQQPTPKVCKQISTKIKENKSSTYKQIKKLKTAMPLGAAN